MFDTFSPLKWGNLKPNEIGLRYIDDNNGGGTPPEGTPPVGDPTKPWFESLPDDLKADPTITKYKTVEELAKGHLNANKLIGAKGVIVPKPDAPQEEKDKFFNTLGRPEKPEGYKLSKVEGLHKSIQVTPEAEKIFFSQAHKLGLTNQQADELNKWYMGVMTNAITKNEQDEDTKVKELGTKLQQEWGSDYQKNVVIANRLLEKFGGKEIAEKYLGVNGSPELIKVFASVAKVLSEDSTNSIGFSNLASSAADANRKIAEIRGDKNHAFNRADDPRHDEAVQDMYQLHKISEGLV